MDSRSKAEILAMLDEVRGRVEGLGGPEMAPPGDAVPMQPIVIDEHGRPRFRANALIKYLFESGRLNLNELATVPAPPEDRAQLAQMLGYSVSGYGDLSYAVGVADADAVAERLLTEGWVGNGG